MGYVNKLGLHFEMMTIELSGEKYTTMSLIIPLVRGIQHSLKNRTPKTTSSKSIKLVLLDNVSRRLGILESNLLYSKATFLDPRFKKAAFGVAENAETVQKLIINEISSILHDKSERVQNDPTETVTDNVDDEDNIWSHFYQKVASMKTISTLSTSATLIVKHYLEIPLIARTQNPLEFWI